MTRSQQNTAPITPEGTPVNTNNSLPPKKSRAPLFILFFSAAIVFTLLLMSGGSMYTVDQGERGVVLHYGEVSKVAEPGLHFKMPYIDRVVRIPVRTTTGSMKDVFAYSSDQQPAHITLSVTFSIAEDGVEALYTQFGKTEHREELNNRSKDAIVNALAKYPYLRIASVQIENVDFSDAYEQTIEDRMKAEVEVERYKQNLERERIEAQIAATRAQGLADAQIKAAEAEAKAIELRSKAEADSINTKGEALRKNPEIIRLMQAERWNGVLPRTMLPGGTVPMLALPAEEQQ